MNNNIKGEIMSNLVKIVYDSKKKKLRARKHPMTGHSPEWVTFPNHLREDGAVYEVGDLTPGKGSSWRAKKPYRRLLDSEAMQMRTEDNRDRFVEACEAEGAA